MKKLLLILCVGMLLGGCRKQETYVSPRYDEIQQEFAPTAPTGELKAAEEDPDANVAVTPFVPFQ